MREDQLSKGERLRMFILVLGLFALLGNTNARGVLPDDDLEKLTASLDTVEAKQQAFGQDYVNSPGKVGAMWELSCDVLNANEGDPKDSDLNSYVFDLGRVDGIIHRSSMGTDGIDNDFAARIKRFGSKGYLVGAYHFVRQNEDAKTQARHFIETIKASPNPGGKILLAIDAEYYGAGNRLYPSIESVLACAQEVNRLTGVYPGIYTGQNFLNDKLNTFQYSAEQKKLLSHTWLWVARYSKVDSNLTLPKVVPPPFSDWLLWQVSEGPVPSTFTDKIPAEFNVFKGSREALKVFWENHSWDYSTHE